MTVPTWLAMASLPEKGLDITRTFKTESYAAAFVDEYRKFGWLTHGPERIERECK